METSLYHCDSPGSDSDQDCIIPLDHSSKKMHIWNDSYSKWHECDMLLQPPHVHLTEYEDTRMEIQDIKHFKHIHQRWFYGNITRREAKYILFDYGAGEGSFLVRTSESYNGKFAISFVHEDRVKHVVIETKFDKVCGVLYHITPQGPFCETIEELIERAKQSCIIQNHMFEVILTTSPPKPNQDWLYDDISYGIAEHLVQRDSREGAFLVYRTCASDFAPYALVHKHNGIVIHSPIMLAQRSSNGFTLNGVTAPVLYKLIHFFMENPLSGNHYLMHPVKETQINISNSAIVVSDFIGSRNKSELCVYSGSLISNISRRSTDWCVGDHRGDKQKFFPTNCVEFLTREELKYINEARKASSRGSLTSDDDRELQTTHTLNLKQDYKIKLDEDGSTLCCIYPANPMIKKFRSYRLSFQSTRDLELWYQKLEQQGCIPGHKQSIRTDQATVSTTETPPQEQRKKKDSCTIC